MVVDSKVSEDIYVLYLYEGVTQAQLAKHFKVPRRVIREILNRGL
jgi:DNA-binding transcriptional regulator LsrR (DeoR family)